jgi:dipeptidyl-peptidase-4
MALFCLMAALAWVRVPGFSASPWPPAGAKQLTLEDMVHSENLIAPGISALQWRPSFGEAPVRQLTFVRPDAGSSGGPAICEYDLETRRTSVLFDPSGREEKLDLSSYQWSPRGNEILLSGENDEWLLNPRAGELRRLTHDGIAKEAATFSPSGDRVAFVKQHDLYAVEVGSGAERRLTQDGSDTIYNGLLDWVYGEELADRATSRAYEWSPDGKRIAYLRLDDGPVPDYPITDYRPTHVRLIHERFPQAGDPNPLPSLHVVAVEASGAASRAITLDPRQVEYFGPSFTWTPDGAAVCFLSLNRDQTEEKLHRWSPADGADRVLLAEHDRFWINSLEPPRFIHAGRDFLWTSERDGWQHVYLYTAEGALVRQITRGPWMIDRPEFEDAPLFELDPAEEWMYFASTNPDPRERQVYRIHLDGSGTQRLTTESGSHTLNLSPDGRQLMDLFSTPDTPPVARLLNASGALVSIIDAPANHLADYALGKLEFVTVKSSGGEPLDAELLKPPDFDPARKYPVIVDIYGGPRVQMVQKGWDYRRLYAQLLAQKGFLVWQLDNHGSWGRGHQFESAIFENMGKNELEDQLRGVDYLKSLPYVDASRIGLRGWSYGGYMTLYALTHAPGVFTCGAAGAPVTDWKVYDSIYTERYMRTPAENPDGYESSSPLEAAANLRGKVLILHGTSDDNVHLQNTIDFIDALIRSGKSYEFHLQPGQKHGFDEETAVRARDRAILEFFEANLEGRIDDDH